MTKKRYDTEMGKIIRVEKGDDYFEKEDGRKATYKTYGIHVVHKKGTHYQKITVFGDRQLRDLILKLLNNELTKRKTPK